LEDRFEILKIHTKLWAPPPSEDLLRSLASRTVGYCGADLKHLCSESALRALQKHYPEIYETNDKLELDLNQIVVTMEDFERAIMAIVPTSRRSTSCYGQPLDSIFAPLLSEHVTTVYQHISDMMKNIYQFKRESILRSQSSQNSEFPASFSCQRYLRGLVINGTKGQGQNEVASAVIHKFDSVPVFCVDFTSLHKTSAFVSAEHTLVSILEESVKKTPSLLFLPNIDEFWRYATGWMKTILIQSIETAIGVPQLVLATCSTNSDLPDIFQNRLLYHFHTMNGPSRKDREIIFSDFLLDIQAPPILPMLPRSERKEKLKTLNPPMIRTPQLLEKEEVNHDEDDDALRILRMKLRVVIENVSKERKFFIFLKPLSSILDTFNESEGSDSGSTNQKKNMLKRAEPPLCLYRLLDNVDASKYSTVSDFRKDVNEMIEGIQTFYDICSNNGFHEVEVDSKGTPLRLVGRAIEMRDKILTLLHHRISKNFEKKCIDIASRKKSTSVGEGKGHSEPLIRSARLRGQVPEFDPELLDIIITSKREHTKLKENLEHNSCSNDHHYSLNENLDALPFKSNSNGVRQSSPSSALKRNTRSTSNLQNCTNSFDFYHNSTIRPGKLTNRRSGSSITIQTTPTSPSTPSTLLSVVQDQPKVLVDMDRAAEFLKVIVNKSGHLSVRQLIDLHSKIYFSIQLHSSSYNRNLLLSYLEQVVIDWLSPTTRDEHSVSGFRFSSIGK
jgi:hypothetical protein